MHEDRRRFSNGVISRSSDCRNIRSAVSPTPRSDCLRKKVSQEIRRLVLSAFSLMLKALVIEYISRIKVSERS